MSLFGHYQRRAGGDQCRRGGFFNEGRSDEAISGAQIRTVIDRYEQFTVEVVDVDTAFFTRRGHWRVSIPGDTRRELWFVEHTDDRKPQANRLRRFVGRRVSETQTVIRIEDRFDRPIRAGFGQVA